MNIRLSIHRKMIIYLIPAVILIFGGAISFIIIQSRQSALADAKLIADESAEKYASIIKAEIETNFDVARGVAYSINSFFNLSNEQRTELYDNVLSNVITANPQYVSFWLNSELQFIDPKFIGKSGRARFTYYRDKNRSIKYKRDSLDFDSSKINKDGDYQKMKVSKKETLLEPYFFSYSGLDSDRILETSICVPFFKNYEFAGLVGSDIELDYFQELINDIKIFGGGYVYLISNQGVLLAFPDPSKIGESLNKLYTAQDKEHSISKSIEQGNKFSYKGKDFINKTESYITFIPVQIGEANNSWSLAVSVPFSAIQQKAKQALWLSLIISLIGVILLSVIIYFISRNISNPLKATTKVLRQLSLGNINESEKLHINSGDEIEEMAESVNLLIDGLNRTAEFAKTIGNGNLKAEYQNSGDNDILGNSLLEMRHSLILAEEEDKKRKIEDEKHNWATQGQAKFGEILRQHNQEINQLSFSIMSQMVDYIGAIQGGLFIKNDEDSEDVFYELNGAVAYNRQKLMESKFRIGESLIGRCAYEKMTIYMEEVPENYVHVTSGLGESNPRSILLVPAILNDEVYAVIELVSFNKFATYQIEFVEKIGENIASTLSNAKVGNRTNKLLEQSKQQSEELAAQEEEMRQNLEELQATQEEVERLREEEQVKTKKLIQSIEKHRIALLKILDHIPLKVFLKDHEGRMLIVNKKVLTVHNAKMEDLIGKNDFDFIPDHAEAKKQWDAEQNIIKSGVLFHEIHRETINNSGFTLDTTKYPFYIDYLEETGILGVQIDITKEVEKDALIAQLQDEIKKLSK